MKHPLVIAFLIYTSSLLTKNPIDYLVLSGFLLVLLVVGSSLLIWQLKPEKGGLLKYWLLTPSFIVYAVTTGILY